LASRRGFADLGFAVGFAIMASPIWASRWASRRGGLWVLLGLWFFAVMVFVGLLGLRGLLGLWFFCCDGGFVVFLWWFAVDYWCIAVVDLQSAVGFCIFFFFILRRTKHRKIFSEAFSKMQTNTVKTNIFL
jgi:hypothetical protein